MTVKGILESPAKGDCLADFIVRTRSKNLRHCDLSTVLSAWAERLLLLTSFARIPRKSGARIAVLDSHDVRAHSL
jgi:hypothetical protein